MAGSMDDREVHLVNVTEETVLTVMIYPTGAVTVLSNQSKAWVAETLRRVADSQAPGRLGARPQTPMRTDVPDDLIDSARNGIDAMIADLKRRQEPATTADLIETLSEQGNLTDDEHRTLLATTAALLLQLAVYA